MSESPLGVWLRSQGLGQGDFAALVRTHRTDINAMVQGRTPLSRKVRTFLAENAPEVLASHDDYMEARRKLLLAKVAA